MEEEVIIPSEQDEEIVETPVAEPAPAPMAIKTNGRWAVFESLVEQEFVVGKTYDIKFDGKCEVMISAEQPKAGIVTSEIVYTKEADKQLWVKTGI